MNEVDLERAQREEARWRILRALDAGRPMPVSESVIWRTLTDATVPASPQQVRRELVYLQEKLLLSILNREGPTWSAQLTAHGTDVVEYTVECPPGINRPQKWW